MLPQHLWKLMHSSPSLHGWVCPLLKHLSQFFQPLCTLFINMVMNEHWWDWGVCSPHCKSRVPKQSTRKCLCIFWATIWSWKIILDENWPVDTLAFVRGIVLNTDGKAGIQLKKPKNTHLKFSLKFLLKRIRLLCTLSFQSTAEMLDMIFIEMWPFMTRSLKSLTFEKE